MATSQTLIEAACRVLLFLFQLFLFNVLPFLFLRLCPALVYDSSLGPQELEGYGTWNSRRHPKDCFVVEFDEAVSPGPIFGFRKWVELEGQPLFWQLGVRGEAFCPAGFVEQGAFHHRVINPDDSSDGSGCWTR